MSHDSGQLSHPNPAYCECRGHGWILTNYDTWEECPCHRGHPHPEDGPSEPLLLIDIEHADGSPYTNNPVYCARENCADDLEEARARARWWRTRVNQRFPGKNLRVRLYRKWR